MFFSRFGAGVGKIAIPVAALGLAAPASATSVDVELVFFIDYSGSNELRRQNLAGQVESFLNALTNDPAIATARMAIMGSFGNEAVLHQDLTDDVDLLNAAITGSFQNSGGPGDEDYLETLLSALPDLPQILSDLGIDPDDIGFPQDPDTDPDITPLPISYTGGALKSLVVLADEVDQSPRPFNFYQPIFAASEVLVNLIVPPEAEPDPRGPAFSRYNCETSLFGFPQTISSNYALPSIARPADAIFSICDFDDDPVVFFEGFAAAKVDEFRSEAGLPPSTVPVGPAAPMLLAGLGGLAALRRRAA
jgi:hypothetical protein